MNVAQCVCERITMKIIDTFRLLDFDVDFMMPTHHGTSINKTRFTVFVKETSIERFRDFEALGGRAVRTGHSAVSHLGTWEHARQQIDPALMICCPHKTRRGVATPGEAAKSSIFKSNYCWSTSDFFDWWVVLVRSWSGGGRPTCLFRIRTGPCPFEFPRVPSSS